jgi:hypothetical protein
LTPIDPNTYKAVLDQVTDGVYIVDTDRRIVYWNDGRRARRVTEPMKWWANAVRRMDFAMLTWEDTLCAGTPAR